MGPVLVAKEGQTYPPGAADRFWGPVLEIAPERSSGVPEDVRADEAAGDSLEAAGETGTLPAVMWPHL